MIDSLRILMIAPQYRPIVGGYERAAERLSAELVRRGHHLTVVTDRRRRDWPARETSDGVVILRLWCVFRPRIHMATALFSLAWFLLTRGRRFDVWHAHTHGPHAMVAIALSQILRRPVILKLTSSGRLGIARSVRRKGPGGWLAGAILQRVSAVVALTSETVTEAAEAGIPGDRIHQLGNGVDVQRYRLRTPEEHAELQAEKGIDGHRVFISVGRLIPDKNIEGLLDAWVMAKAVLGDSWLLLVVGDGELRQALELRAREFGIERSVRFVGQQQEVERWFGAANIYVSSSDREGLSNTLLEAMASGLPSVATRVSGVPELVDATGAGIAVDVGDTRGLGEAMIKLAKDEGLASQQSRIAREVIEGQYSIERVAQRHEMVYRALFLQRVRG